MGSPADEEEAGEANASQLDNARGCYRLDRRRRRVARLALLVS